MGWKSKKDGTHFNTDKTVRSSEPSVEVNLEIDNNSDEFSEGVKKDFENQEVEIMDIGWDFGDQNNIKYKIDEYGDIKIEGGIEKGIEELGGRKLSHKETAKLSDKDHDFNFDEEEDKWRWKPGDPVELKKAISYAQEKQNDNTYNFSSLLHPVLNYGIWEDDLGRTFLSLSQHISGDVRGNYEDPEVYEITGIDTGATGEPKGDISEFLAPSINYKLKIGNRELYVRKDGMNYPEYDEDGTYVDSKDVEKLFEGKDIDDIFTKAIKREY